MPAAAAAAAAAQGLLQCWRCIAAGACLHAACPAWVAGAAAAAAAAGGAAAFVGTRLVGRAGGGAAPGDEAFEVCSLHALRAQAAQAAHAN
eukprot:269194-Pelagomonas_calceolata.AAC.2